MIIYDYIRKSKLEKQSKKHPLLSAFLELLDIRPLPRRAGKEEKILAIMICDSEHKSDRVLNHK